MTCRPSELILESAYQIGYYSYLEDPDKVLIAMFSTECEAEEALRGWDDAKLSSIDVRV